MIRFLWRFSMRRVLSVGIILVLLAVSAFSQGQTWTLNIGARKAIIYAPSGTNKPPLIISMHGVGIPAIWNQGMMKFEPIADREKFIVAFPEAENLNWDIWGMKDVNFVLAVIDSMAKRYNIDRNRVYASGFSMGGMMSYLLACKVPDKIAAIAPGNGSPFGKESGCTQTRSVPIFHIQGTADPLITYSAVRAFLNTKIAEYGCPQAAVMTKPYPPSNPTSKSFKEYWGPCTNNNGQKSEITLISVDGMIHDWATPGKLNASDDPKYKGKPFDVNGSEEAWAYLKTQSLTGPILSTKRGSQILIQPMVSATYTAGRIHLESAQTLHTVKVFDLQGKALFVWNAGKVARNDITIPVRQSAQGIYLLDVDGSRGHTSIKFVARD